MFYRHGTCKLRVIVLDVNDCSPVFEETAYDVKLMDVIYNASSLNDEMEVLKVKAIDSDSELNAKITYRLIDDPTNGKFRIDEQSGQLYVKDDVGEKLERLNQKIISLSL